MEKLSQEELIRIRDLHEAWLKTQPGFVGSGVGLNKSGEVCLKIFSDRMPASTRNAIIERLQGIPTAIEETGQPRLQA